MVAAYGIDTSRLGSRRAQCCAGDRRLHRPEANAVGSNDGDLPIVGFSQGTMMALHVGLRRKKQVAGILGYSGTLTGAADLGPQKITKPPFV